MPAKHQSGLGRGLGELFQRTDVDETPRKTPQPTDDQDETPSQPLEDGSYFQLIPVSAIRPNPKQPRTVFDEEALNELVESIQEVGVLQPIVVRAVGDDQYELIMGERRWRATTAAGLEKVPAIVRGTDDGDLLRDALLENLHRAQLNPLEEAAAYQQMLSDFGCTQEELATKIKRSRPQISNTIRLLRLPAPVQRRVAAGVLSAGHARALLMVEDPLAQERLAQRIVAEGLSVRAVEEIVAMGDGTTPVQRKSRGPKEPTPRAMELSSSLSDHFDTRVKVDIGRNKGKITIEFASEDDLERILNIVNAKEF
ncbi:ParB/RepB/Spo0J family partition protein [Luteococcus peritonei]|uniref:ParB/RepB/Spo0J family partition protein n=1 Tax=Luteococcus peritonei TaxID=88874 RepID=A0ABW4RYJ6_9ACTN